ncbi:MAG: hypothetical protein RL204_1998 [Bacteroidota bacterium]|jgi:hypothetical protein
MKYISILLIALALGASSINAKAQDLIGIRGGWYSGITYQHYMGSNNSLEFIGQFTRGGSNFTGLYEIHSDIPDVDGLKFYYGGGAHLGFYQKDRHNLFGDRYNGNGAVMGIDGIIGIEYFFKPIPLQLSLDYKPALNIGGGDIWLFSDLALAVRVVF